MKPTFFATAAEFRAWLEKHHGSAKELWVGYYKRGSGKPSITWAEAVGEALCFGWIDGVGKGIDDVSHIQRFTPRKPDSTWSTVNVRRAKELIELGLMRPAGLAAFERRSSKKSGTYSYEQKGAVTLDGDSGRLFRAEKKAWIFFQAQAPSYRRAAVWWVVSAKREGTKRTRLATLIEDSLHGRTLRHLTRRAKPGATKGG